MPLRPASSGAALAGAYATPAFATEVGVSISVGQAGLHGQIDIGNFPRPQSHSYRKSPVE